MLKALSTLPIALACAAALTIMAHAQQADLVVPPAAMSGAIAPMDETFALYAASSGLAQTEAARLVLKKTQRAEVRDLAQVILRAHTQALDELRRTVASGSLKLPATPTGRHADLVTKLSGLAAADLDDAFLQRVGIDAHKETIALFERHAKEGQDPALRHYAQATLGPFREHLAAAQKLMNVAANAR